MTADSLDRVETLVRIGATLIGAQFEEVERDASAIETDSWTLGYCFGLFDAMAQFARLDQHTEGAAMIAEGIGKLVGDRDQGKRLFARALELMDEAEFSAGYERGGADLAIWASDPNKPPGGVARRHASPDPDQGK